MASLKLSVLQSRKKLRVRYRNKGIRLLKQNLYLRGKGNAQERIRSSLALAGEYERLSRLPMARVLYANTVSESGINKRDAIMALKGLVSSSSFSGKRFKRNIEQLFQYGEWKFLKKIFLRCLEEKRFNVVLASVWLNGVRRLQTLEERSEGFYWLGVAALHGKRFKLAGLRFVDSYLSHEDYWAFKSLVFMEIHGRKMNIAAKVLRKQKKEAKTFFLHGNNYLKKYKASFNSIKTNSKKRLKRAVLLFSHGLDIDGGKELNLFFHNEKDGFRFYRGLMYFFYNIGNYQQSIRYCGRLLYYLNGSGKHMYVAPDLVKYFYPILYEKWIDKYAEQNGLNKYLVLALIREESRFMDSIVSWAGARGLMQIMPRTGRYLSRKIRLKPYSLTRARDNIQMGCFYLNILIKKFNSINFALAAYNGGEGNMRKRLAKQWGKHNRDRFISQDHFIANISNNETRNYVFKVMKSYYRYLDLYCPMSSLSSVESDLK